MRIWRLIIEQIIPTAPLTTSIESRCWLKDYEIVSGSLVASNKLKILQINLHHCKQANLALGDCVLNNRVDIILSQNPYVLNGDVVSIPSNCPSYLSTKNTAVICITNSVYVCIGSLSKENVVFINLNVDAAVLHLGSHSAPPIQEILRMIFYHASFPDCSNVLLGGGSESTSKNYLL